MKYVSYLFITFVLILPLQVFGQMPSLGNDVEISPEIIPRYPGANETVTVNLVSYTTDIDTASITWSVDGKKISSGVGQKKFQFKTGDFGTETVLGIKVVSSEGTQSDYQYNFRPAKVDVVWQSDSLVPPFYKGKALFSHQNKITFIAIAHLYDEKGNEIDPTKLIYKWSANDDADPDNSGYGKYVYTRIGNLISRPLSVTVQVSSSDGVNVAYGLANVTPVDPFIAFYEKNPLYGIQFQKALTNTIDMPDLKELTIFSFPFYSGSPNPIFPDLVYKWAVNGSPIENSNIKNIQVLRRKEGSTGTAKISLSVENTSKILQYASGYFSIVFKNKNNTSGL